MASRPASRPFRADSQVAAKRVTLGIPVLAVATLAILVIGHLVKRRNPGGKRLGGESGDRSTQRNGGTVPTDEAPETTECLETPGTIEELRARRIRALEMRLARGNKSNDPGCARLTPLGTMLKISKQVDEIEKEVECFLGGATSQAQQESKRQELVEMLKHLRSEIDYVQVDETVREHRKTQSFRIERLMLELQQSPH